MYPLSRVIACLVSISVPVVLAQSSLANIKPAAAAVEHSSPAGVPLQPPEIQQVTEDVIRYILSDPETAKYAKHFVFDNITTERKDPVRHVPCKSFPGYDSWPELVIWDVFNRLLDGALVPTVPIAAPCYDTKWGGKSEAKCTNVINNFTNPLFHEDDPTSIMWPIFQGRTCMPHNDTTDNQCSKGGYPEYAVKVTNVAQIQLAINFARTINLRLVIKNTGHCYLGKSSGAGALSLWTHNLKDIDFLPDYEGPGYSGPALKLGAGVSVREVYEAAEMNGVTVLGAVSWSVGYAGGMIAGGGQNPLAGIYGMAADHVVAFNVVTAAGRFITVSESSHSDLFWALRGGGGSTFAVIVSVIIRAHPKLDVVTSNWILDTKTNSEAAYWTGVKKFYDVFLDWTDAGIYSFYIHTNSSLDMRYLFAPNHTVNSYTTVVKPFLDFLREKNITLSSPKREMMHTSFYSAYQSTWGSNNFPIGRDDSLPANRLIPRANFEDKYDETWALIREHIKLGKHFLGYHNAPVEYANTNNAVNPAWRNCVLFLVTSSNKSLDHSTPEGLAIANSDLQNNILQPWRDIAPVSEGGGVYLNEASVMESDWQESFYGGYYPRLSEIKRTWDPNDVFYATTAVGSERWIVQDGHGEGVQTQNGRLCRA